MRILRSCGQTSFLVGLCNERSLENIDPIFLCGKIGVRAEGRVVKNPFCELHLFQDE